MNLTKPVSVFQFLGDWFSPKMKTLMLLRSISFEANDPKPSQSRLFWSILLPNSLPKHTFLNWGALFIRLSGQRWSVACKETNMHTVRELPVAAVWLLTQGFSVSFFGPRNEIFSLSLFLKQKPVSQLLSISKIRKEWQPNCCKCL